MSTQKRQCTYIAPKGRCKNMYKNLDNKYCTVHMKKMTEYENKNPEPININNNNDDNKIYTIDQTDPTFYDIENSIKSEVYNVLDIQSLCYKNEKIELQIFETLYNPVLDIFKNYEIADLNSKLKSDLSNLESIDSEIINLKKLQLITFINHEIKTEPILKESININKDNSKYFYKPYYNKIINSINKYNLSTDSINNLSSDLSDLSDSSELSETVNLIQNLPTPITKYVLSNYISYETDRPVFTEITGLDLDIDSRIHIKIIRNINNPVQIDEIQTYLDKKLKILEMENTSHINTYKRIFNNKYNLETVYTFNINTIISISNKFADFRDGKSYIFRNNIISNINNYYLDHKFNYQYVYSSTGKLIGLNYYKDNIYSEKSKILNNFSITEINSFYDPYKDTLIDYNPNAIKITHYTDDSNKEYVFVNNSISIVVIYEVEESNILIKEKEYIFKDNNLEGLYIF